ncbi:MAG TPA: DUF4249 family protein [Puia sp.]|jgi:hypothetical protein|nr:DUF4249 family protein [Puia sp.]
MCLTGLMLVIAIGCQQSYTPPPIKTNPNLLVVEGIINSGPGTITSFTLSRTQRIGDSSGAFTPELSAQVTILGSAGDSYALQDQGKGIYTSSLLSLNQTEKYQLKILTANGSQYLSDAVSVQISPPIDSLAFQQNDSTGNVVVSINTHDPSNNSHYYRWYFTETWEYHSEDYSELALQNGLIIYTDTFTSIYYCWRSDNSTDILLGNSTTLNQDLISQAPLTTIPRGSGKIGIRYSMLASQYVLSQAAYQYWLILQKNTQNLGSLFDPQPSQLTGNYHCLTNPGEPVIGYLSAGSIQQLRFFIQRSQVANWDTVDEAACKTAITGWDQNNYQLYSYPDTSFGPWYFSGSNLILNKRYCLDCRLQGGTTQRPSFW